MRAVKKNKSWLIFLSCVLSVAVIAGGIVAQVNYLYDYHPIARVKGLAEYSKAARQLVRDADFYVSVSGSDAEEGSFAHPFATLERAKLAVRALLANGRTGEIKVAVMGGEYRLAQPLSFAEEDSGKEDTHIVYTAYGDGEVTLTGGVSLPAASFKKAEGADRARLDSKIADNVYYVDLSGLGISKEEIGKLYSSGFVSTAKKYDGDHTGDAPAEVFCDSRRMTLARYPNEDLLKIKEVTDLGDYYSLNGVEDHSWDTLRNPEPGTFITDAKTKRRINSWATLQDVWMLGYFYWDWADMTTPVKEFDNKSGAVTPYYASFYSYKKDASYYFYNVFEELDVPGEYYIDRDRGYVFVYPEGGIDQCSIELSLTKDALLEVNADYLTFDGLTVCCGRGDGASINGNHNVFTQGTVRGFADSGMLLNGKNNTVSDSEIAYTGKHGMMVGELYTEGETGQIGMIGNDIRENGLEDENNLVINNAIHDFGELKKTYVGGVYLSGVGNRVAHNEIYNAPHFGIGYEGNNQLIEYNYIHDVVKTSSDAGAIYAGRNHSYCGNVIRYNCIDSIGSGEHIPNGIYFDDGLSGQTAYGNILINIPYNAFMVGGGRDNAIYNNLIINTETPIRYDDRMYQGIHDASSWYAPYVAEDGRHWELLADAKRLNELWGNPYPEIASILGKDGDPASPDFLANPTATIANNITVSVYGNLGRLGEGVKLYADIHDNASYRLEDIGFVDYENGNYNLTEKFLAAHPWFQPIPMSEIGRMTGAE